MQTTVKKTYTALLAMLAFILLASPPAWAVPSLQLYIPGASYDYENESWMTYANPFDLEVVLAQKNYSSIEDINLHIAVPDEWYLGSDGIVTVQGPGHESTELTFNEDTYHGTPEGIDGEPDRLPARLHSIMLPDIDFTATHTYPVYNRDPTEKEEGEGTGVIYNYIISYDPKNIFGVHLNLTGYLDGENFKFAPFSHNADAPTAPEPTTMLLFGTGLLGVAWMGRRQMQKRKSTL